MSCRARRREICAGRGNLRCAARIAVFFVSLLAAALLLYLAPDIASSGVGSRIITLTTTKVDSGQQRWSGTFSTPLRQTKAEEGGVSRFRDEDKVPAPRQLRSRVMSDPTTFTTIHNNNVGERERKFGMSLVGTADDPKPQRASSDDDDNRQRRELAELNEYFNTLLHERPGNWDGEQWIFLLVLFIVIDLIWCAACCLFCRGRGGVTRGGGSYRGGYMV